MLGLATALLALAACCGAEQGPLGKPKAKPNFIFIMTDDQDLHMNSLDYQPAVKKHFTDEGTFFSRHFCTVSQCCPSRVSLLTGKAAHNTNVTAVNPPYGGYEGFTEKGWNDKYLPIWLQDAGYNTYYTGKLMNSHSISTYNKPFAKGWNSSDFLIDPGTYVYYNSTTQRDRDPPKWNPGVYSTDLVAQRSVEYLDEALNSDRPFFLGVAPIGPHGELIRTYNPDGSSVVSFHAPVPAKRHEKMFPGLKVPRTANFNPKEPTSASWIKSLDRLNQTAVDSYDDFYRKRIQSLQAIDDLIDSVMDWLHQYPDVLDNTYIVYTTDNGYHVGQHRMGPGKTCALEEDINIPFFIRGPGVPKGKVETYPTTHTDIVPTLFSLAGIPLHTDFDGEAIPVHGAGGKEKTEHVNVEFWGQGGIESEIVGTGDGIVYSPRYKTGAYTANNTYKALRVVGEHYNLMYSVWCTNEHELYDMQTDRYQMKNLYESKGKRVGSWDIDKLSTRLDALLLVLKSCRGRSCTKPWEVLHPEGQVSSLQDAMSEEFDTFYEMQPRVSFSGCGAGYFPEMEGPQSGYSWDPSIFGREAQWEDET